MAAEIPLDPSSVATWIFDLDNTLYPARCDLFALIDERMMHYVQRLLRCSAVEARTIQKAFFRDHGTTLSGLMAVHGVDPYEFLEFVHDIALDRVTHDARLVDAIERLPGRKLVFTNGDDAYARRVLNRLGLSNAFAGLHDIHAMNYVPKPAPESYTALCARWEIDPTTALFAEDMVRNLKPAKDLGMMTLWVNNGSEQMGDHVPDFIDYETHDLTDWLHGVTREMA